MIISYFFPPEFNRDSSSVANSRVTSVLTAILILSSQLPLVVSI